MQRSLYYIRLRKKYMKEKRADPKIAYNKRRNYCANLLGWIKTNCFANIIISSKTDYEKIWKTVKPIFWDKISHEEANYLAENETTLSDDQVIYIHSIIIFKTLYKIYLL